MRKVLIFVFLISFVCNMIALPKIKLQTQYLQLDSLYVGMDSISFSLKYSNIGNSPLYITNIRPLCHCITIDEYSTEALVPGDTALLSGKFMFSEEGEVWKPIKIFYTGDTDSIDDQSIILTLVGTVYND